MVKLTGGWSVCRACQEEQAISVPLQLLCLAILDSVFVFILNQARMYNFI